MRLVPPPDTAAVGDVVGAGVLAPAVDGAAVAVAVTVAVAVVAGGAVVAVGAVGVGVGVAVAAPGAAGLVAVLLVTLPIALLTELPHPAARHPAARIVISRRKALLVHRMFAMIR